MFRSSNHRRTLQASSNEVTRARGRATKDVGCEHRHLPITNHFRYFDLALTILKLSYIQKFFTSFCVKNWGQMDTMKQCNAGRPSGMGVAGLPATVEFVPSGSLAQWGRTWPNSSNILTETQTEVTSQRSDIRRRRSSEVQRPQRPMFLRIAGLAHL